MADIYRIGAFFDGTGGNKGNDLLLKNGSETNIARLYDIYETEWKENEEGEFQKPLYEEGVGTRDYKDGKVFTDEQVRVINEASNNGNQYRKADYYNTLQLALALEAKDISDDMLEKISSRIENIKDKDPSAQISVDVYGFSRGAAISRDFVNSFNEKYKDDPNVKTDFVGLFDTVASVGTRSNIYNGGLNLNLNEHSANKIVHLTAENERRYNFPLNSLKDKDGKLPDNIKEISLPGVHGDIGAGDPNKYVNKIIKECGKEIYDKEIDFDKQKVVQTINQRAENLGFDKDKDVHITAFQEGPVSIAYYAYTKDFDKTNDLGKANLHVMLNEMEKHGIELNKNIYEKEYALPNDLKEYVQAVKEGGDISEYKDKLASYTGISGGNISCTKEELYKSDAIMNIVNKNSNEREIFTNNPDEAFRTIDTNNGIPYISTELEEFFKENLQQNSLSEEFKEDIYMLQTEGKISDSEIKEHILHPQVTQEEKEMAAKEELEKEQKELEAKNDKTKDNSKDNEEDNVRRMDMR
jgi:hypothetical protein